MGISLWLIPSEPESALLKQLMSRHPKSSAPHSYPHFHPHVTLATISPRPPPAPKTDDPAAAAASSSPSSPPDPDPDPDPATLVLALREAIPLGQRALRTRFARVLAGDHYFRSIYTALVPSTELAQLRAAVAGAATAGGEGKSGPAPPAFPHLSLFYIADEEAHARVRLLQELEREGVVRHSADGLSVALRCGAGDGDGGGDGGGGGGEGDGVLEGCTCTQIWIVDCEGPVEEWKVLDKILLATSDR